jgi:hypothetical protein
MPNPDSERVAFYARQISQYVERAADCIEPERQDEFLWHSRRATEAILLALLAVRGEPDPAVGEASLEKLRGRLGELPQVPFDVRADLDAVRNNCNMGGHALLQSQSAVASTSPTSVGEKVRRHFPEVLKWARDQPVLGRMLDSRFEEQIRRIATASGRSRVQQAYQDRDEALRNSRTRFVKGTLIGGLMGVVLGGALVFAVTPSPIAPRASGISPRRQSPSPPEPSPASIPAPPSRPAMPSAFDASAIAVTRELVPSQCPAGTHFVAASSIAELRPPSDRPSWPNDRRVARGLVVPAMCIDLARVRADDFARCVADQRCSWSSAPQQGEIAATRLDPSNATRYCQWRGEQVQLDGDLPSITDWESIARTTRAQALRQLEAHSQSQPFEWVFDAAFPALWGMRARPGEHMTRAGHVRNDGMEPHWSWNHTADNDGAGIVAFRCRFRLRGS